MSSMTALIIVLIVLAVFAFLFAMPISAVLDFHFNADEKGGDISVRYLFLNLKVFPKEKKIEEEAEKTEKDVKKKEKKKKKSDKKTDYIKLAKAVYEPGIDGVKRLLRYVSRHAVTFRELNVSADLGLQDPAATGMAIGAANAAAYGMLNFMDNHMRLKSSNVSLVPNFSEKRIAAGAHCVISTNIFHVLALAGIVIRTFIKIQKNMKNI